VNSRSRPALVTAVGLIGIAAGTLPAAEILCVLLSERFRAWFLPLVRTILPVRQSFALELIAGIAVADLALGAGVLARKRFALYGMIARSLVGLPIDYLNFIAGNRAGALFGLAVNIFMVWALVRTNTRLWFSTAST
jgi:hypothetical protein